jgi:hypothetical protein
MNPISATTNARRTIAGTSLSAVAAALTLVSHQRGATADPDCLS